MKILDVPQSGSLAGSTSSRNRYGQYRRTRAQPTQPRTARQVANRASLAAFASAWRSLTATQRAGWEALAAQLPRTDSLGQTTFATGLQTFVGFRQSIQSQGSLPISDAPAATAVPDAVISTVTLDHSTPTVSIALQDVV